MLANLAAALPLLSLMVASAALTLIAVLDTVRPLLIYAQALALALLVIQSMIWVVLVLLILTASLGLAPQISVNQAVEEHQTWLLPVLALKIQTASPDSALEELASILAPLLKALVPTLPTATAQPTPTVSLVLAIMELAVLHALILRQLPTAMGAAATRTPCAHPASAITTCVQILALQSSPLLTRLAANALPIPTALREPVELVEHAKPLALPLLPGPMAVPVT